METRRRATAYVVIGVILIALIGWLTHRYLVKRHLIRSLSHNEIMGVRVPAARELLEMGKLEDALPAQPIIRRSKTAEALGYIGTEEALRVLGVILRDQEEKPRQWARRALEEQGMSALPVLLAALSAGGATGDEAIEAIEKLGPDVAPQIRFFLSDGSARGGSATALAKLGGVGADALIRACYNNDKDGMRKPALNNLGPERVRAAVDACLYNLEPLDKSKKEEAIKALGLIGERRAVPAIIPFLKDVDNRHAAVTALGQIGDPRAVEPIVETLTLSEKRYRDAAILALRRIGRPAFPALVRELRSQDLLTRQAAAAALVGSNSPSVTAPLIAALHDADPEVRASAALALGWERNLDAVAPLVGAADDADWRVVDGAVAALGKIGPSAMARLLAVLSDPSEHPTVRYQISRAFVAMGHPAVDQLVSALSTPNSEVQKWSAVALGDIGLAEPDVITALEELRKSGQGDVSWVAGEQLRRLQGITSS